MPCIGLSSRDLTTHEVVAPLAVKGFARPIPEVLGLRFSTRAPSLRGDFQTIPPRTALISLHVSRQAATQKLNLPAQRKSVRLSSDDSLSMRLARIELAT